MNFALASIPLLHPRRHYFWYPWRTPAELARAIGVVVVFVVLLDLLNRWRWRRARRQVALGGDPMKQHTAKAGSARATALILTFLVVALLAVRL